jgi:DHA1 family tetracycline resistance protein-like MFS transporter
VGEGKTLLIGAAVGFANLTYVAFAPNSWWYAASVLPAAFSLLLGPGLQGMISANAGPDEQGRVRGAMQGLGGIATVLGPPIYGAAFAWSLRQSSGMDLSGVALLVAAGFMAAAFFLSLLVVRRTPPDPESR